MQGLTRREGTGFFHTLLFPLLVCGGIYWYLYTRYQGNLETEPIASFVRLLVVGMLPGFIFALFNRWTQLLAGKLFEPTIAKIFLEKLVSFLIFSLPALGLIVFSQISRRLEIQDMNSPKLFGEHPILRFVIGLFGVVILVTMWHYVLGFIVLALGLTGALWLLEWGSGKYPVLALSAGFVAFACGYLLGVLIYTLLIYLRIFLSRRPLQTVVNHYGKLTTQQLLARTQVALKYTRDFNLGLTWKIEQETAFSRELTAKFKADKELLESMIAKARAEHELRFYQKN